MASEFWFSRSGFLILPPGYEEQLEDEDAQTTPDTKTRPVWEKVNGYVGCLWVRRLLVELIQKHGCSRRRVSEPEAELLADWLLRAVGLLAVSDTLHNLPEYLDELWGLIAGRTREYPLFCKLALMSLPAELRRGKTYLTSYNPRAKLASAAELAEFATLAQNTFEEILPMRFFKRVGPACNVFVKEITGRMQCMQLNTPADSDQLFECMARRGHTIGVLVFSGKMLVYGSPTPLKKDCVVHQLLKLRGC